MDLLIKISDFLSRRASLFIIFIAVFSYIFNKSFVWVHGNVQTFLLGFIMLSMGLTLTNKDLEILKSRPFDILIGTVAQFSVMPILAFLLTKLFDLPIGISLGLMLVGCCPGGVSSNIMSFLCNGDVAFSIGMTTVNTILAPIVTPLLLLLFSGQSVEIDALSMFLNILLVTILPVSIGFILNRYLSSKETYINIKKAMPGFSVIGLALIVGGVVCQCCDSITQIGFFIFLIAFIHNTLGYIVGFIVGYIMKFPYKKKKTISIEVGMQNAGLATNLATNHFTAFPEAAVMSAICCIWHSISGTILANIYLLIDKKK